MDKARPLNYIPWYTRLWRWIRGIKPPHSVVPLVVVNRYKKDIRTIALFGSNDVVTGWTEIAGTRIQIDFHSPKEWSMALPLSNCSEYNYIQIQIGKMAGV